MDEAAVRQAIVKHLRDGGHVTLFLDYDGTLVPIAPTPAQAMPDADLMALLGRLSAVPSIRTVIISGRPLEDLLRMLPVRGLLFAGLYGVEMRTGDNTVLREPLHDGNRQTLIRIREGWTQLTAGAQGFLLEDKGHALALHGRWARPEEVERVLPAARDLARALLDANTFRLLDGERYLEVAPVTADKGETVDWILDHYPMALDLAVGFGDDNKDDAAFAAIHRRGGYAIGVDRRYPLPDVDARLDGPAEAREWLTAFINYGSQDIDF